MTSDRMIASNRSNGRLGRGPRTAAGKATSSRNALRHGLAVSLLDEPAMRAEVETLARMIAGAGADDARLNLARAVAEAQLDLARIQAAKVRIMNSYLEASASEGTFAADEATPLPNKILQQLFRLGRYESSAFSRRRRAMRTFHFYNHQ